MKQFLLIEKVFKNNTKRILIFFFAILLLSSVNTNAQITISTSIVANNGTTSVLSGQTYTVQLNYSVSSTTGTATGLQAIIDLPDSIYGIANYVGTADAPVANFVVTNIGGDRKLVINFVSPIASGSSGVLQFNIITQNLTTPNGTVLTTTAVIKDAAGNTSPTVTNSVTVNATPSLCARKSLLSGGAIGYPTTYRVFLSANGDYQYQSLPVGVLQPTNITVTDVLPAGATFISAKVYTNQGVYLHDGIYNSGTVTASMPNILPSKNSNFASGWGSSSSYMDVTVQYDNPPFSVTQAITNNASVEFTPLGGTPTTLVNGSTVGTCTSDLIETTTLAAPIVSATMYKSPSAGVIYPGQPFLYNIGFTNTSNIPLQNLEIIDDFPAQLRLDTLTTNKGVRIDGAAWAYIDHLEYKTNISTPIWIALPPATSPNMIAVPPDGGYVTGIKYVFKSQFPANTAWPLYVILNFKAIDVVNTMSITNCINWNSTTPGIPVLIDRTKCATITENPRPDSSKINYRITSNNTCPSISIGNQVTFNGTVTADAGYADALNPICAIFIPSGMQYVPGSEIFTVSTSGIAATPTLQIVPNYITIGVIVHDMYRWTFPAGTVLPYGKSFSVSVKAIVTNALIPGTLYSGSFIATASNASVNTPDYNYGNITDTHDWDLDGIVSEIIGRANTNYSNCFMNVTPSASLQSTKWVKGQLDTDYSKYPNVATTVPGGNADYKLIVKNPGNITMKNITLIDILPFIGDRGVIDSSKRLSEWRPNLAGPISAPVGITVYYSTEANPCRDELKSPTDPSPYPTGCVVANWSTTPPSDLTKVQSVKIDFGATTLAGGDSLVFSWPMRAPLNSLPGDTAWNSFAYTATRSDNNIPLLSAEPIKVGIQVVAGSPAFYGDKVWYDTNHNGIQDAGEGGVDGVIVKLFTPTTPGVQNPATDQLVNFTITGNGGQYLFSNLPPGDYYAVFITPTGYTVSPVNASGSSATNNSDGTVTTYGGLPATITPITNIATNETDLTWDQGMYCGIVPSVTPAQVVYTGTNVMFTALGGYNYLWTGPNGFTANTASINLSNIQAKDTGYYYVTISDGTCAATLPTHLTLSMLSALGDHVWIDVNKNGIQEAGESGVAGITVTLFNASGAIAGTTVTDAYGNYLFTNLTPGNYSVGYTLPSNYTFTQQVNGGDNGNNSNSDANPSTGTTLIYALTASEIDTTVDAGIIFSSPLLTSNIGDNVWFDTDADGLQTLGEPGVSGVTVTLYQNGVVFGTTITDAIGNYLFTNVPAGSGYTVGFTLPPAFIFTPQNQGVNDSIDSDVNPTMGTANFGQTAPFTVITGVSNLTLDAGIYPQPATTASLGDFVWDDLNHDGIQNVGEPGIAGVVVNLLDASGNPVLIGGNPVTTITDAFGEYQFNNLAAGSYIVQFVAPAGYTISPQNAGANIAVDNNANPLTGNTTLVVLSQGDRISTIDAGMYNSLLQPGITASIGNFVWLDENNNGIQDIGEGGVSGVTVTLYNSSGIAIASTSTDVNGNYIFVNLAPGTYSVGFTNLPNGTAFTAANAGGNDAFDSDVNTTTGITNSISITAGQNYTDFDAGLVQGISAGLGTIGNQVWYDLNNNGIQETSELGVSNVTITLMSPGTDGIVGTADDLTVATTTTDALGQYIFGGLQAGSYYVVCSDLPAGYNVSPQNVGTNDTKDSDGSAILGGVSVSGIYNLASGEDNLTIDFGINNPSTTNNNTIGDFVWLDTNGDGVQTAGEMGVSGVQVTLLDASGNPVLIGGNPLITTTDVNGEYQFTGLPDGTYSVGFSNLPTGLTFTSQTINTTDGSDANITTGKTGTVTVTGNTVNNNLDAGLISTQAVLGNYVWNDVNGNGIQDTSESGVSGVTVTLYAADGITVITTTITGANGSYLFTNLNPGTYVVGFSTLPTNTTFTSVNSMGSTDSTDSDVMIATGKTDPITLTANEINLNVDAGITTNIPATVGDYVWIDANANGLQDAGEPGVGGVVATLYDSFGNQQGSAITNGTGQYLITNVTTGTGYYVVFSNLPTGSTFTTSNVGGTAAENNSQANVSGQTLPFNVLPGQHITNQDAGIIGYPITAVLPVKLIDFTAEKAGNTSLLKWTTAQEINSSYIEVERSANGINFYGIQKVTAVGLSITSTNYSITDNTPLAGINYYRLKFVDRAGNFEYSKIRTVSFAKSGLIELYPNPAVNSINITVSGEKINKCATINIINAAGKLMYQQNIAALSKTETINVSRFANGKYTLQIINEAECTNKTFIIIR